MVSMENFRADDITAAVHFDLRIRAKTDEPTFVKSRDIASRVDCTKKQAALAMRFLTTDETGLSISQWSGEATYPKVWEVRRRAE